MRRSNHPIGWEVSQDDCKQQLSSLMAQLPSEGAERLTRSLDRTDTGFKEDLRTPFYKGESREWIIDRLEEKIGFTSFEELTGIDERERDKIGPMSIMVPYKEREESVKEYWHQEWHPDHDSLRHAVDMVKALMPARSLRPAEYSTAFEQMPKDTSLGLPWLTRDRSKANAYLRRAHAINKSTDVYPAVLYWRGQSKGLHEIPKQRVVWGFDHAETIRGARLLYPLIEALKMRNGFSAWLGDVYVDQAITDLLNKAQGRRIISMDFSGFDSSLAVELLDCVDAILASWFDESGANDVYLLGEIANTVSLVVPFDVLSGRNGGMPSGSVLTNMRDTIANLIAGVYAGVRSGSSLVDYEVLGDDSVYVYDEDMDPKELASYVEELGLSSNADKQFVSTTSCHYLQRWHSRLYITEGLCRGVRSPFRTLSGMVSYERFRKDWNKYMDTSRWIMQVENCKNDPRFVNMVKFLKDGDVILSSGVDPTEVFKRAGGADVVRSVLGIASFPFNVQNPEKVEVFETTRVLRSLE
jgi:hypothetical protein